MKKTLTVLALLGGCALAPVAAPTASADTSAAPATSSAAAPCPYTGCAATRTTVRGDSAVRSGSRGRYVVKVKVVNSNESAPGTLKLLVRGVSGPAKGYTWQSVGKRASATGVRFTPPPLSKGRYEMIGVYRNKPNTPFRSSSSTMTVRAR